MASLRLAERGPAKLNVITADNMLLVALCFFTLHVVHQLVGMVALHSCLFSRLQLTAMPNSQSMTAKRLVVSTKLQTGW